MRAVAPYRGAVDDRGAERFGVGEDAEPSGRVDEGRVLSGGDDTLPGGFRPVAGPDLTDAA